MTDQAVVQILKAINDFREEFRDEKKKNDKRWEENDRRWEENNRRWREYEENRKRDREDIKNILWSFQTSVEEMYKENKDRIIKIGKLCSKCKVKVI